MKRRDFLKVSAVATLASGVNAAGLLAAETPSPPKPLPPPPLANTTPPVLQNVSETAATVIWGVSGPATGWVEFGDTDSLGRLARGEVNGLLPYDGHVLRVRLTGLKPGQRTFYRVWTVPIDFRTPTDIRRGEAVTTGVHAFTTLDDAAGTARFTVWNDTHQNKETLARLIEHLPAYPSDLLVWNGDVFNDIPSEDVLIEELLHPAGRAYAATQALVFVRGNHDVRGAFARRMGLAIETPGDRYYYSFRQGPVAFLVLDTGEDKEDGHPEYGGLADFARYRLEQQSWLEQAIARPGFQSAPFRVLLTHIPLRGPNHSADARAKWEPLLAKAGIDFAISGHTHRHAYEEPTAGQPFPLLVGGGPGPDKATFIHAEATTDELRVRLLALDGSDLGHWSVPRRSGSPQKTAGSVDHPGSPVT